MNIERARFLRHASTEAEKKLWHYLRNHQLHGFYFRRQFPIGPYVVDFICRKARLIVELDGGQHADDTHVSYDATRTAWLGSQGYRVLRFWNNEVRDNIDGVLHHIAEHLRQPSPHSLRSSPSPSR